MFSAIGLYTLVWVTCAFIVTYQYQKRNRSIPERNDSYFYAKKKLSIIAAIVIAGLFTIFNVYATTTSVVVGGDRQNYTLNFNGLRASPSILLTAIIQLIHSINGTIETLYYFTTFVCVTITMLAYRVSKEATPQSIVLLCVTQYFLTTLTALKQCYASALAILFFVMVLEYKSEMTDLLAVICIVLACLSHTTGFVLIPLFFIIKAPKTRLSLFMFIFVLLLLAFFFEPFMVFAGRLLAPISPRLGGQILSYFSESSESTSEGIGLGFLKGVPYYYIAIYGCFKRKVLKKHIRNYDNYLIVVSTGALLHFVSIYSEWFGRFIYLFSFTSFVFWGMMMKQLNLRGNRIVHMSFVFLSLAVITYRFLYLTYALWGGF